MVSMRQAYSRTVAAALSVSDHEPGLAGTLDPRPSRPAAHRIGAVCHLDEGTVLSAGEPAGGEPEGLASAEAAARLDAHGPNVPPTAAPVRWWVRVARQFAARSSTSCCSRWRSTWSCGSPRAPTSGRSSRWRSRTILVFNTAMGVWQEYRAEDALEPTAGTRRAAGVGDARRPPRTSSTPPCWFPATWSESRPVTGFPPTAS